MSHGHSERGRRRPHQDYWPGFVDVLSTLLLVVIFLMSIFMIAQYFVSQELSGKDSALERLNKQISSLTELLALERTRKKSTEDQLASMQVSLTNAEKERARMQALLGVEGDKGKSAEFPHCGADRGGGGEKEAFHPGDGAGRAAEPADRCASPPDRGARRCAERIGEAR